MLYMNTAGVNWRRHFFFATFLGWKFLGEVSETALYHVVMATSFAAESREEGTQESSKLVVDRKLWQSGV